MQYLPEKRYRNAEGENGRVSKNCGSEHLRGFKIQDPKNVLFKHKKSHHANEAMEMKMVIKGSFREVIRIYRRENKTLLNSKCEMNHPPVARVTIEKENK